MNTQDNIEAIYPLSPMQQGMLFHSLYTPESGVYFEQLCFTLHGDLDIAAFERAWQSLIDRHQALRTVRSGKRATSHCGGRSPRLDDARLA